MLCDTFDEFLASASTGAAAFVHTAAVPEARAFAVHGPLAVLPHRGGISVWRIEPQVSMAWALPARLQADWSEFRGAVAIGRYHIVVAPTSIDGSVSVFPNCAPGRHGELCEYSCADGVFNGYEDVRDCGGPCAEECDGWSVTHLSEAVGHLAPSLYAQCDSFHSFVSGLFPDSTARDWLGLGLWYTSAFECSGNLYAVAGQVWLLEDATVRVLLTESGEPEVLWESIFDRADLLALSDDALALHDGAALNVFRWDTDEATYQLLDTAPCLYGELGTDGDNAWYQAPGGFQLYHLDETELVEVSSEPGQMIHVSNDVLVRGSNDLEVCSLLDGSIGACSPLPHPVDGIEHVLDPIFIAPNRIAAWSSRDELIVFEREDGDWAHARSVRFTEDPRRIGLRQSGDMLLSRSNTFGRAVRVVPP